MTKFEYRRLSGVDKASAESPSIDFGGLTPLSVQSVDNLLPSGESAWLYDWLREEARVTVCGGKALELVTGIASRDIDLTGSLTIDEVSASLLRAYYQGCASVINQIASEGRSLTFVVSPNGILHVWLPQQSVRSRSLIQYSPLKKGWDPSTSTWVYSNSADRDREWRDSEITSIYWHVSKDMLYAAPSVATSLAHLNSATTDMRWSDLSSVNFSLIESPTDAPALYVDALVARHLFLEWRSGRTISANQSDFVNHGDASRSKSSIQRHLQAYSQRDPNFGDWLSNEGHLAIPDPPLGLHQYHLEIIAVGLLGDNGSVLSVDDSPNGPQDSLFFSQFLRTANRTDKGQPIFVDPSGSQYVAYSGEHYLANLP